MSNEENEDIYILLRIKELLDEAYNSDDRALFLADYASASVLISGLEARNARDDPEFDGYLAEKLSNLKWHFSAMLGLMITNKHPKSQHYLWAIQAIDSAKSRYQGA